MKIVAAGGGGPACQNILLRETFAKKKGKDKRVSLPALVALLTEDRLIVVAILTEVGSKSGSNSTDPDLPKYFRP